MRGIWVKIILGGTWATGSYMGGTQSTEIVQMVLRAM